MGMEGKAREKIILALVGRGWIRVRNYGNRGWSLNVKRLSDRVKDSIYDFFEKLYPKGGYDSVKIDSLTGVEQLSVNDILHFKLYTAGPRNTVARLIWVSSIEAFEPVAQLDRVLVNLELT